MLLTQVMRLDDDSDEEHSPYAGSKGCAVFPHVIICPDYEEAVYVGLKFIKLPGTPNNQSLKSRWCFQIFFIFIPLR